jgi:membrane protein YdbS with pleckstrin-like domain
MFVVMPAKADIQALNGVARLARDLKSYLRVESPAISFSIRCRRHNNSDMKDYKYLASRDNEQPQGQSPEKENMNYLARPAWLNQWWQIGIAVLLPVIFVLAYLKGHQYFSSENLRVVYVVIVAVFVYLVAVVIYRRYSWAYTIDSETIESREGLIARKVKSIRIQDLRNINVNQSLWQRIVGVGDVEFSSAGGSGIEVVFRGVDKPLQVKQLAQRRQGKSPGD